MSVRQIRMEEEARWKNRKGGSRHREAERVVWGRVGVDVGW